MNSDGRNHGGAKSVNVSEAEVPKADQPGADADQRISEADQEVSAADQAASVSDQASADRDQVASDRDQATADRHHAAGVNLSPADEAAYETSRDERGSESFKRHENQIERGRTVRDRDVTAGNRDLIAGGREERGRTRVERGRAGDLAAGRRARFDQPYRQADRSGATGDRSQRPGLQRGAPPR